MKTRFVIFSDDVQDLYAVNNSDIMSKKKKLVIRRETADVNERVLLRLILEGKTLWKYRMYDMNNRRRNVWLVRETDYKNFIETR